MTEIVLVFEEFLNCVGYVSDFMFTSEHINMKLCSFGYFTQFYPLSPSWVCPRSALSVFQCWYTLRQVVWFALMERKVAICVTKCVNAWGRERGREREIEGERKGERREWENEFLLTGPQNSTFSIFRLQVREVRNVQLELFLHCIYRELHWTESCEHFKSYNVNPGWCGSWIESPPVNQRFASSIPSQDICLGCRPGQEATTHWCFSPSLSPFLLHSLKMNK